jgi:hypothetical protein
VLREQPGAAQVIGLLPLALAARAAAGEPVDAIAPTGLHASAIPLPPIDASTLGRASCAFWLTLSEGKVIDVVAGSCASAALAPAGPAMLGQTWSYGNGVAPTGVLKVVARQDAAHALVLQPVELVSPKITVHPLFPEVVNEDEATCEVTVVIGPNGRAQSIAVDSCDDAFARSLRAAYRDWLWEKPVIGDQAVSVRTRFDTHFKRD